MKEVNNEPEKIEAVKENKKSLPPFLRNILVMVIALIVVGACFVVHTLTEPHTDESVPTEATVMTEYTETTEVTEATVVETTPETTAVTEATEPVIKPTEEVEVIPEVTEAPVTEETTSNVGMSETEMLACVIYQEVGSDSICDACRYRVADIVLNRVADERFPNSIYGVLTQSGQYGKFSWTGITWPSRASNSGEAHAVQRAYDVANDVLNGNHSELYGNGYIWQAGFVQGSDGFWCCGHFYGR